MQMGVKEAALTTLELSGSCDTLQELGRYILTIQPEGLEPVEDMRKYVYLCFVK